MRESAALPRWLPLLACLYLPFVGGGWLTDDFAHIERLASLATPAQLVDEPDAFGFYRPVTQASLALGVALHGPRAAWARAFNVALHAVVICLALVVSSQVLASARAAGLTALAFALTPKAHPIAVLWISARAELLMAAFSLAAVAAWIVWANNGRRAWLVGAATAYVLALLSKETATLLPLLLLVTPCARRPWTSRVSAVASLVGLAVVIYMWRVHVGAITPFSGETHYDLMTGVERWVRNGRNYTGRMIAAPLLLVVLAGLARFVAAGRATAPRVGRPPTPVLAFSCVWVVVFLAPVLPIVARSELYLYLPVFGLCLLAGWAADACLRGVDYRRAVPVAIGLYVVTLGAYQVSRGLQISRDLAFSEKLVAALQGSADLAEREGVVVLVPSDAVTERLLQDSIGNYLDIVLRHALGSGRLTGVVQYDGTPVPPGGVRLLCEYRQREVRLMVTTPTRTTIGSGLGTRGTETRRHENTEVFDSGLEPWRKLCVNTSSYPARFWRS